MDDIPPETAIEFLEILRDAFKAFDTTNSGKISVRYLEQVMNQVGLYPTTQELHHMEQIISPTGTLTFADFTRLFASAKLNFDRETQFREIFKAIDRNCDGFVGASELKCLMDCMHIPIERKELEEMLVYYKGEIGFAAFCRIIGKFDISD